MKIRTVEEEPRCVVANDAIRLAVNLLAMDPVNGALSFINQGVDLWITVPLPSWSSDL